MLRLVAIYFIGRHFSRLAIKHKKNRAFLIGLSIGLFLLVRKLFEEILLYFLYMSNYSNGFSGLRKPIVDYAPLALGVFAVWLLRNGLAKYWTKDKELRPEQRSELKSEPRSKPSSNVKVKEVKEASRANRYKRSPSNRNSRDSNGYLK